MLIEDSVFAAESAVAEATAVHVVVVVVVVAVLLIAIIVAAAATVLQHSHVEASLQITASGLNPG